MFFEPGKLYLVCSRQGFSWSDASHVGCRTHIDINAGEMIVCLDVNVPPRRPDRPWENMTEVRFLVGERPTGWILLKDGSAREWDAYVREVV